MKPSLAIPAAAGLVLWLTDPGAAYRLNGPRWASGSSIVMHLQLGSSSGPLSDGSPDWNAVTEGALATWNPYLGNVSFRAASGSSAGVSSGNGVNNVAWADDMYGEAFGSAIAVAFWRTRNGTMAEVDVLFDRGRNWNSYRGGLRGASGGGTVYDLRRVALHELGHVLGLGHPDEHGQSVAAVMNSRVSSTDNLQSDDVNGAVALYGGSSSGPPAAPASNRAPSVTASCSPCTVEAELTSALRATAADPDGDALSYQWSAPEGAFSDGHAAVATWSAPRQSGRVAATVTVRDSRGATATATVTLEVIPRDKLPANRRLQAGQSLLSANLRYRLAFQGDGNLVLYDDQEQQPLWASNTGGITPGEVSMQGDGNIVIYDAQGLPRWSTGTVGSANAYLIVQNDGNLVAYSAAGQPIWDRSR